MIWQRIQPGDVVQNPKRGQHERVIDGSRARPDLFKSERTNNAGILRQMRFVVPDEAGVKDSGVCY